MVDLNSLIPAESGFVITNAEDINDRGQIVAQGYETSNPTAKLRAPPEPHAVRQMTCGEKPATSLELASGGRVRLENVA